MALKNVNCDECGQNVSFTIDSSKEIVKVGSGRKGIWTWSESKKCPSCDEIVGIDLE